MKTPFLQITLDYWFNSWQDTLKQNEIGFVFCPPISGREYRIQNFIDWYQQLNKSPIKIVNLLVDLIEEPAEVKKLFETNQPLIVTPAEKLLEPGNESLLHAFIEQHRKNKVGLLFFAETFPSELSSLQLPPNLLQNSFYLEYADKKNTYHFISYLCELFSISEVNETVKESIFQQTGGQLWLTKEIIRQFSKANNNLETILNSDAYEYKKSILWNAFPTYIKEYLLLYTHKAASCFEKNTPFKELSHFNIVNSELHDELAAWLSDCLHTYKKYQLRYDDQHLYCNDVIVDSLFTKRETELIKLLLENKNNVISRETIASTCWNAEDEYSDWAIDQVINRLRKKLVSLGFEPKILETIKSKGIIFNA